MLLLLLLIRSSPAIVGGVCTAAADDVSEKGVDRDGGASVPFSSILLDVGRV